MGAWISCAISQFSSIHRWIDDGITVIVLTNHSDRIVDQLAIDIAGLYEPALRRRTTESDSDPAASSRIRKSLVAYLEGKPDPEDFTAPMRIFMKTTTGTGLPEWIASHGKLEDLTLIESEELGDDRIVRFNASLGGDPYLLSVRLRRDGKIAQIRWW